MLGVTKYTYIILKSLCRLLCSTFSFPLNGMFFFFTKTYIYDEFHLVGTDCDEMLLHFVTVVPKIGGGEPGKAKEYQFLVLFLTFVSVVQ